MLTVGQVILKTTSNQHYSNVNSPVKHFPTKSIPRAFQTNLLRRILMLRNCSSIIEDWFKLVADSCFSVYLSDLVCTSYRERLQDFRHNKPLFPRLPSGPGSPCGPCEPARPGKPNRQKNCSCSNKFSLV